MLKIQIKPLSVNEVWQGQRFKTQKYKIYEQEVFYSLPNIDIPEGDLTIELIFGISNMASDYDNMIKPFQDILQKKYGFNDNRIQEAKIKKVKTKKGEEFIEFKILPFKK